jgi:hypothetical protein
MKETLEEAAEDYAVQYLIEDAEEIDSVNRKQAFKEGAKWQEQKMYSYEDLEVAYFEGKEGLYSFNDWFEQLKKK